MVDSTSAGSNKKSKLGTYITTMLGLTSANSVIRSNLVNNIKSSIIVSTLPFPRPTEVLIGTHDGTFHCDEALAIGMLKILPKYSTATVLRTRNPDLLATCDIIVDVGATYEPEIHRYDHHQREFVHTMDGYSTRLSSAGLIYRHFGKEILNGISSESTDDLTERSHLIDIAYDKLYKDFLEHIDANDNGIAVCDGSPKYHISSSLPHRVSMLNPAWNDESNAEIQNERFAAAMLLTSSEFLSHAESLTKIWWPARSIVQRALNARQKVHSSGKIIVLDKYCPWKDHLFELEKEENIGEYVLYVLYEDSNKSWRIQAVPVDPNSFTSRKKLPADWCGLRDATLSEKVGNPGAIFVHAGGFIGGHATMDGALDMAIKALSLP